MDASQPRPLLRLMLANAALLSAIYLAIGAAVEGVRRFYPLRALERASLAMDSMPARLLEQVGAMAFLQELYAHGRISEFWIRFTFGLAAVGIIFALGLGLGAAMWAVKRLWETRLARRS